MLFHILFHIKGVSRARIRHLNGYFAARTRRAASINMSKLIENLVNVMVTDKSLKPEEKKQCIQWCLEAERILKQENSLAKSAKKQLLLEKMKKPSPNLIYWVNRLVIIINE